MKCPKCTSEQIIKNGRIHNGKPKYKGKACGRQFVADPQWRAVTDETKALIERLLQERLSLRAICRVTGVSLTWLQTYVNGLYANQPRQATVLSKKARLTLECDEVWSYVGQRRCKVWIWLAMDRDTREIVALHVGDRSRTSAQAVWRQVPPLYRQCAVCYTDTWDAYLTVLPSKRHRLIHHRRRTNHIARFNNTLRQRLARLVRRTLSFAKKLDNLLGSLWFFVHDYNATIARSYHLSLSI